MTTAEENELYDWMNWTYDDNAGVSQANAWNTSPMTTTGNQSNVSPGWLSFLQTAIGTAGSAYQATVAADRNLRNGQAAQAQNSGTARLLLLGGVILAAVVGAALIFRRK